MKAAIKLLTNHMSGKIIPFNDKTLIMSQQKHSEEREVRENLIDPLPTVNPISYEVIDDDDDGHESSPEKEGRLWTF